MSGTIAETLAEFICDLTYGALAPERISKAKDLFLDQLGCQMLGSTVPWNQAVYRFVVENKRGGSARIINYGDRVPPDDAALVNATFGQGCELDDYYDQGGGHPGSASIPVALALLGNKKISGRDLLVALAGGYDVGWRIGRGLLPGMMRRGYHPQGVVGVFVASATAGRILGLNQKQMTHALAIAGSHAAGTMEFDQSGGEVKRLHSGMACSGGLRSAMLAQLGLTGPPTIFEGERGVLKVFGGEAAPDLIVKNLGTENAISCAAIKRFPVNASQHSPIELLDKLITDYKIAPEDVQTVEVGVNEGVLLHGGGIDEPKEVIEAQFSLRFSLALRLLKGRNDFGFYLDPRMWQDPEILKLAKKVKLSADPSATGTRRFACRIKIARANGESVEGYLPAPKGTASNPLTKGEVRDKFRQLSAKVLNESQINAIVEKVDSLELEDDVSGIMRLLTREAAE